MFGIFRLHLSIAKVLIFSEIAKYSAKYLCLKTAALAHFAFYAKQVMP